MDFTPMPKDSAPVSPIVTGPRPVPFPDIPFTKFQLANGLTLIVHEDRSAPLIATEVRYNVGAKDEPFGRHGFAHLFEHLMFKASANRSGNWHDKMAELGGSNVNGGTSYDRTTYYQTTPTGAIDTVLWAEADRMGHLIAGLTPQALAAEIEVVKNEKRQREGAPMGQVTEAIAAVLYPHGHPYHHTVLGAFSDLNAATLDIAEDWFRRWYGAGNAILTLAGDISPTEALAKVEHWFGDIAPGEPIRRATAWLPPRQGAQRMLLQERVANAGLARVWIVPAYGHRDTADLGFIASALTGSSAAALTRRLVEEEALCTAVEASIERRYLCSEFCISATFQPGADGQRIEAIIDEELGRLLEHGPTQAEIAETVRAGRLGLIRSVESLAIRAELLAGSEMTFGAPDGYRSLDAVSVSATPARVAEAGRRWLGLDALTLDIRPYGRQGKVSASPDRTRAPVPGPIVTARFPEVQTGTLSNGVVVRVARRPGSPTVLAQLSIEGGMAGDPIGAEGLTAFTLAQLQSGTRTLGRQALSERQRDLNTTVIPIAELETVGIRCDTLLDCYADAVALMADVALSPAFPDQDYQRARAQALMAFEHEMLSDDQAATRAAGVLTFGPAHMLGRRLSGTHDGVMSLTRYALVERYAQLFRPSAATLFVVGDLALEQAMAPLEAAFGGWAESGEAKTQVEGPLTPRPGRYLVRRDSAAQSVIHASVAIPAFGRAHHIGPALGIFGHIFGGSFGSRLNRSLREKHGWTYGASCGFGRWRGIGSFVIKTAVQTDRTVDAVREIEAELRGLTWNRVITPQEIERAKTALLLESPGYWTSDARILTALIDSHRHDLPERYHDLLGERLAAVTQADIQAIAVQLSDPDAMTVVVAGDPNGFDSRCLTPVPDMAFLTAPD